MWQMTYLVKVQIDYYFNTEQWRCIPFLFIPIEIQHCDETTQHSILVKSVSSHVFGFLKGGIQWYMCLMIQQSTFSKQYCEYIYNIKSYTPNTNLCSVVFLKMFRSSMRSSLSRLSPTVHTVLVSLIVVLQFSVSKIHCAFLGH